MSDDRENLYAMVRRWEAEGNAQPAAELRAALRWPAEDPTAPIAVIVDGKSFPVEMSEITGTQVVWMRQALDVSVAEMVTRIAVSLAELPEMVAMMAVSIEQEGGTVDLAALLEAATLATVFEFQADTDLIDPIQLPPSDEELAAALAVLDRANTV